MLIRYSEVDLIAVNIKYHIVQHINKLETTYVYYLLYDQNEVKSLVRLLQDNSVNKKWVMHKEIKVPVNFFSKYDNFIFIIGCIGHWTSMFVIAMTWGMIITECLWFKIVSGLCVCCFWWDAQISWSVCICRNRLHFSCFCFNELI